MTKQCTDGGVSLNDVFENASRASKFLKALANDNRLVILCTLVDGEKNVGELEEILGIRQPTLSQQLARLRSENLVETRRKSKQIYYRLVSNEAEKMIELLYELFCSSKGETWAGALVGSTKLGDEATAA